VAADAPDTDAHIANAVTTAMRRTWLTIERVS